MLLSWAAPIFPTMCPNKLAQAFSDKFKIWSKRSVPNGRILMTLTSMAPPPRSGFNSWKHGDFKIFFHAPPFLGILLEIQKYKEIYLFAKF